MPITINGSGTITGLSAGGLPDATIVQADLATGVAGTGPAFYVYASGTVSLTNVVTTKIPINTSVFDTNSALVAASNRVQPNVAGYYIVSAGSGLQATTNGAANIQLYKSGSLVAYGGLGTSNASPYYYQMAGSWVVYLNGTTDYLELYLQQNTGTTQTSTSGANTTYLMGALVRSA